MDRARRLAVRLRDWLVPERDAAGIVYGTITMGALLAAESTQSESFRRTAEAATLALALVWAAHLYAAVLGHRLAEPGKPRLSAAELRRLLGHEFAVLKGGGVPLLALLVAWAVGATLGTAITATLWTCAGTLVAAELVAGLRMSAAATTVALHIAAGGSLGAALIALRAILH